jgi:predicted nucleotidyltransferase
MMDQRALIETVTSRIREAGPLAKRCFDAATEVVVFGSTAVGIERPDSDLDLLLVGCNPSKEKTDVLDLIAIPTSAVTGEWVESELASHVARYGVWVKGTSSWSSKACIGPKAVAEKRCRVLRYLTHLENAWFNLDECFRLKYSIKIRRESQRLLLLERAVPVPPTRILDESWDSLSTGRNEVKDCIRHLARAPSRPFMRDLTARIDMHFQGSADPVVFRRALACNGVAVSPCVRWARQLGTSRPAPDSSVDFSDIPESTNEELRHAIHQRARTQTAR